MLQVKVEVELEVLEAYLGESRVEVYLRES
jgi:hypothetical protein